MTEQRKVIALGFFDGVHIGHARLIETAKQRAQECGAEPAVLTFDVHPDTLVRGEDVPLINSQWDRADIIRRLFGVPSVLFIHFSLQVMRMPWQDFIGSLTKELSAVGFVVGYDFRFGHMGEGTAERLREYCAERGLSCDVIPRVGLDGETVSSTLIRRLIADGDIERAGRYLGHPHCLTDTVHTGYRLGKTIGAPTINMRFEEGVLVPRHGVYAAKAFLPDGSVYNAVTNIGVRPTVSGSSAVSVESNLLDFDGDLYDRRVRVELMSFIRDERRFGSVEELGAQIQRDAASARAFFAG